MNQQTKNLPVLQRLNQALDRPQVRSRITASIGSAIDEKQFLSQLMISFGDPKLAGCSFESLFSCAHFCATLALLPSLQQVALIPRKIKDVGLVCTAMPQWQGYKAIMERHHDVLEVTATLVHATDQIRVDRNPATGDIIVDHNPDPFADSREFRNWRDLRGGYLLIRYRDRYRAIKYHFTKASYIQSCAKCAQSSNIWDKWFEQMCLKTVYRDAYSRRAVPVDPACQEWLEQITSAEDKTLGNDPARVADQSQEPYQPPQITHSRAAALASSLPSDTIEGEYEPVSHEPEPEEPADPKKRTRQAKKAKETPAADSKDPPEIPDHLKPAAEKMALCKESDEMDAIIDKWAKTEEEFGSLSQFAEWLMDTGQVKRSTEKAKQGDLLDKGQASPD